MASKPIIRSAGNIERKVERPAKSESDGKSDETTYWVVEVFGVPADTRFLLGDKDFIPIQRARVGMMAAVAVFP